MLNQGQTLRPGGLILQAEIDDRHAVVAETWIEQAAIRIDARKVHVGWSTGYVAADSDDPPDHAESGIVERDHRLHRLHTTEIDTRDTRTAECRVLHTVRRQASKRQIPALEAG